MADSDTEKPEISTGHHHKGRCKESRRVPKAEAAGQRQAINPDGQSFRTGLKSDGGRVVATLRFRA